MILDRPSWQQRAECRGVPYTVMFPENPGGQDSVYREALKFCNRCSVQAECLAFAMREESGQRCRYGMFGGKTPKERYALADEQVPVRIRV